MQFGIGGLVGLVDIADLMTSPTSRSEMSSSISQNFCSKYRSSLTPRPLAAVFVPEGALRDETKNGFEEKRGTWSKNVVTDAHKYNAADIGWFARLANLWVIEQRTYPFWIGRLNFKMSFFGRFPKHPFLNRILLTITSSYYLLSLYFYIKTVWRAQKTPEGGGEEVLWEVLGGDVSLGPWNP